VDPSGVKRRLTCILAADAVGYSGQMGVDEEGTARVLAAHRAVIDGIIAFHSGRILSTAGDSVLAEFPSVVEAVRCAVEIQDALKTRNDALPEQRRMLFRIGVNLGDVMVKNDDLLGDGVNVAARLESIAEPGGICISSSVYDQITGKLDLGFLDIGDQSLKNISRPIRVYRVSGAGVRPAPPVVATKPARKSLAAVLIALGVVAIAAVAAWQAGWLRVGTGAGGTPTTAAQQNVAPAPAADSPTSRAQSDAERLRAEAEALKGQAEAELARARAETEASRAARTKSEAAAAAGKMRAQAEADATRIRAEATAAAERTKSEAAVAVARPTPTETPRAARKASNADIPANAVAAGKTGAFDGNWSVTVFCPRHTDGALGFTREFVAQVKDGYLRGEQGTEGAPNWLRLQGLIQPDGSARLHANGTTGDTKYSAGGVPLGSSYQYSVDARFEGSNGSGRRLTTRACDLRFVKQ